jgi:hypothetical protein
MSAPFPYFGGKRTIAEGVWARFGSPKQYLEPFCGSAAILLASPNTASLEVIGDGSGFIANFWRAAKHQPAAVAEWADYPVSHIDLGARHRWLMDRREIIGDALQDPDWPGDAKVAGWWLWGQCAWIAGGWCDWNRAGKIPHVSDAGQGIQAAGKIPHVSNAGQGGHLLTSGGRAAWAWLHQIAARLDRVRVIHGDWTRCLNHHYGADGTAVFLDPPYRGFEKLYGGSKPVADAVAAWAREHQHLRIALCGHRGDYDMPGWDVVDWSRGKLTYGSSKTTAEECIWYSPACLPPETLDLFSCRDPEEARIEAFRGA